MLPGVVGGELHTVDVSRLTPEAIFTMEPRLVTRSSSFTGFDVSSSGPTHSLKHSFPTVWMSSLILYLNVVLHCLAVVLLSGARIDILFTLVL